MAVQTLAAMGEPAFLAALRQLPEADTETRHSLYRLFAEMAEPQNRARFKSPESRSKLLRILLDGANDPDPSLRAAAAQGLVHFNTPQTK